MAKNSSSSSIESYLTRHFDIRFIDARNIVLEAKISLGIHGYHRKDQEGLLRNTAIQIFQHQTPESKHQMMNLKYNLDRIRYPSSGGGVSSSSSEQRSSATTPSSSAGGESSSSDVIISSSDHGTGSSIDSATLSSLSSSLVRSTGSLLRGCRLLWKRRRPILHYHSYTS
jgi:hypothetical protein